MRSSKDSMVPYDTPKIIPQEILEREEKMIFETHPQKIITLLYLWILGFILILFGLFFLFNKEFRIMGITMEVIAFIILLISYLKWRYTIYGLTTNRMIKLKGIFDSKIYEIPLHRIQDFEVKRNILQRMLGSGDILVTTKGTEGIQFLWKNLKNPYELEKVLRAFINSNGSNGVTVMGSGLDITFYHR